MASEVRGVIAPGKGQPVRIETVVVPDPGPGEALVSVQACGVCHTDLHYREGGIGDDFPYLLGHEASGIVELTTVAITFAVPMPLTYSDSAFADLLRMVVSTGSKT